MVDQKHETPLTAGDVPTPPSDPKLQRLRTYPGLTEQEAAVVDQAADDIRERIRTSGDSFIAIGKRLLEVKAVLGHGRFGPWLEAEFQWDQKTAERFMNVAKRFGDRTDIMSNLTIGSTVLGMLAAPSTPGTVCDEIIERAKAGEKITVSAVKQTIAKTRPKLKIAEEPDDEAKHVEAHVEEQPAAVTTANVRIQAPATQPAEQAPSDIPLPVETPVPAPAAEPVESSSMYPSGSDFMGTRRELQNLLNRLVRGLNDGSIRADQSELEDLAEELGQVGANLREIAQREQVQDSIVYAGTETPPASARPNKPLPAVGAIVTAATLANRYDSYALDVLGDYLEEQPQERPRARQKWKVIRELPDGTTYQDLRKSRFTVTLWDLIDEAVEELRSLGSEIREWYDNLPDGLRDSSKAGGLEEAANTLDDIESPDLPDDIAHLTLVHVPGIGNHASRSDRRDDAVAMLQAALEFITHLDDTQHAGTADDLERIIEDAEQVCFPGMCD